MKKELVVVLIQNETGEYFCVTNAENTEQHLFRAIDFFLNGNFFKCTSEFERVFRSKFPSDYEDCSFTYDETAKEKVEHLLYMNANCYWYVALQTQGDSKSYSPWVFIIKILSISIKYFQVFLKFRIKTAVKKLSPIWKLKNNPIRLII